MNLEKPNNKDTANDYIKKCLLKKMQDHTFCTYADITNAVAKYFHEDFTVNAIQKRFKRLKNKFQITTELEPISNNTDLDDILTEIKKERVKASDERNQTNAYIRRMAREETLIEIAREAAEKMKGKTFLESNPEFVHIDGHTNEAILEISDWHYGIDIVNYWNTYDPEECRHRVSIMKEDVIDFCMKNKVRKIHVVNLGDMIAGRIHKTIQLESRIDVITQIIEVSEIIAEFIAGLAEEGFEVDYYDCLDNHSRLEPIKDNSLDLESLARITKWYLKNRFQDVDRVISIHDNEFTDDIIAFKVLDGKYRVGAVHGDKDRPSDVVKNLTLMTQKYFDLILTSHMHHFSADEVDETLLVMNGSLMGTDTYAKNIRRRAKPSQNLILVTDYSVADSIHRIVLK